MENFIASNGDRVVNDGLGIDIRSSFGGGYKYLSNRIAKTAFEYGEACKDKEIGRWRSSVYPDYVVYPYPVDPLNIIRVLDEQEGILYDYHRDTVMGATQMSAVASEYFNTHKLWWGAKRGEVWELKLGLYGHKVIALVVEGHLTPSYFLTEKQEKIDLDAPNISNGQRIYPDGED